MVIVEIARGIRLCIWIKDIQREAGEGNATLWSGVWELPTPSLILWLQVQPCQEESRRPTNTGGGKQLIKTLVIDFQERQMPSYRHPHSTQTASAVQDCHRAIHWCLSLPSTRVKMAGFSACIYCTHEMLRHLSVHGQAGGTDLRSSDFGELTARLPHETEISRTHLSTVHEESIVEWL